jgi:hypothetical protein
MLVAWQISVIDEGLLTTKTKKRDPDVSFASSHAGIYRNDRGRQRLAFLVGWIALIGSIVPAPINILSRSIHPFDRPKSAVLVAAAAAAVVEQKMFEATAELQQLETQIAVLERVMAAVKSADTTGPVIGKIVDDINAAPDLFLKTNESPNPFHAAATGGTASTDGGCCIVV